MTVGIEHIEGNFTLGDKSRSDTPDNTEVAAQDTQDYQGKAEVENLTTLYIEPAIMANDMFGLYLKGGISHTRVNSLESLKTLSIWKPRYHRRNVRCWYKGNINLGAYFLN